MKVIKFIDIYSTRIGRDIFISDATAILEDGSYRAATPQEIEELAKDKEILDDTY